MTNKNGGPSYMNSVCCLGILLLMFLLLMPCDKYLQPSPMRIEDLNNTISEFTSISQSSLQPNMKIYEIECSDGYTASVCEESVQPNSLIDIALSVLITQTKSNTTYQLNLEKKAAPESCVLISIYENGGNQIQVIEENCTVFSPYYLEHILKFDDFNCDGYADVAVIISEGTMNVAYQLYVWSPTANQFLKVTCEELLCNPEVKDGTVVDIGKLSAANLEITHFLWENEYTLVKTYSETVYLEDNFS